MIRAVSSMARTAATLDEDQEAAAVEAVQNIKDKQKRLLESLDMEQYAIKNEGFDEALRKKKKSKPGGTPQRSPICCCNVSSA